MTKKIPVTHEKAPSERSKSEGPEILAIESIDDVIETKHTANPHLAVKEKKNPFKRFGVWYWSKKKFTLPLSLLLVVAILLVIPTTRYLLTSWFWKESITIVATDAADGRPVSEATVTIAGQTVKTDGKGRAELKSVAVGPHTVMIDKRYYKSETSEITVPWFAKGKEFSDSMTATGRSVKVTVANRISGRAVEGALVSVIGESNQTRTDTSGKATIILPADKKEMRAEVSADTFNKSEVILKQDVENSAKLTPTGKVYFLSKQSGKIDVVSTNLDGSERKIVLAGTGRENDNSTSLFASTDWKYLALKSQREAGKPEVLQLISTSDDKVSVIDQGNVTFELVGWAGHQFIYSINRNDMDYRQAKRQAIKTFDADVKKVAIVEENAAEGPNLFSGIYEYLSNAYIVGDNLIYTKNWSPAYLASNNGKQLSIVQVRADGISKRTIKTFPLANSPSIDARLYRPDEVYFQILTNGEKPQYFELEDGSIKAVADGSEAYAKAYPTYLISPSGNETFWSETRDGKSAIFIGNKTGDNQQQLALQSEFKPYGWLTDSYLLLQKKDSELYITTKDQLKAGAQPVKISDYHKLLYGPTGYGSGYGGQ